MKVPKEQRYKRDQNPHSGGDLKTTREERHESGFQYEHNIPLVLVGGLTGQFKGIFFTSLKKKTNRKNTPIPINDSLDESKLEQI